jgi:release factor glutamine methyltransferase
VKSTIAEAIRRGVQKIQLPERVDSPGLDVELLLARTMGRSRTYLLANRDQEVDADKMERFNDLLDQRRCGVPVAYLLGSKEFRSIDLAVDDRVLIPRPDSETLVECALRHRSEQSLSIADLGTGSGAIALALARELPHCHVMAVDNSKEALEVARSNVMRLGVGNVEIMRSNWFDDLEGLTFDLVVSNPPYIDSSDTHLLGDVRFEPRCALVSGANGLADLSTIIRAAPGYIRSRGWLMVEHGYLQARAVAGLFHSAGFSHVRTYCDMAGNDRVTEGQRAEGPGI